MQPNNSNYNRTSSSPVMYPMRSSYGSGQASTSMSPMPPQQHGESTPPAPARALAPAPAGRQRAGGARLRGRLMLAWRRGFARMTCTPGPEAAAPLPAMRGHQALLARQPTRRACAACVAGLSAEQRGCAICARNSVGPRVCKTAGCHAGQAQRRLMAARRCAGSLVGTNFQAIPAYSSYSGSPR